MDKRKSAATSRKGDKKISPAASAANPRTDSPPGWANGLRQLYDAVVDEPLPDAFKDLLSKLDSKS